ncbi:hypothetical protein K503DRAFT_854571 [Rhizopogon vinicolor AM-OR11-026]|uniref:Mid2 domain-containing protein n=1 Tax=Rhizopogon vinicolor AM-OR11-026 TaxID=1314800 RepID=A0A1B7N9M7_9AGAM|nr:hypothetical protein K503DRAFT_854571 [Rhizopogon vinicolor AM-OR11-026]
MSCVSSPTATEYTTITTYTTSTSLSQSVGSNQASVTTIVQQTCVATGTLSGSNTGCVSSTDVTLVSTIGGGGGSTAQVPVIVTVSVTETQPTNTLYATCSDGSTQPQNAPSTTSQPTSTSTALSVTTTVLVESTPPPSIISQETSTTLSNGDVVATTIITTSTLPPSSVYVPSIIANPTATGSQSGSGTNVAPIVGGVIGGFVGLILIVTALWYFCRKRTSWDDIFDREDPNDEEFDHPIAVRQERDRNRLDLGAEPKPYQYGLVGHVTPPPGSGSSSSTHQPPAFHRPSFTTSMASGHSRNTSITPLLGAGSAPEKAPRPSTTGSVQAAAQLTQRQPSATSHSSTVPRTLSLASTSSSAPLIDGSVSPSLSSRVEELGSLDALNRTGSPVPVIDRRVLQIINDPPQSPPQSPVPSVAPASPRRTKGPAPRQPTGVVQHRDAGQAPSNLRGTTPSEPPPYSRE